MLQAVWLREQGLPHRCQFGYNTMQARINRWLDLPKFVFSDQRTVEDISAWNVHGRADFHETLTLFLPPNLLHAYLEVAAVFAHQFPLAEDKEEVEKRCTAMDPNSGVCMAHKVWGGQFCKEHSCYA